MSLEQKIEILTVAIQAQNVLLEKALARATGGAPAAAAAKPTGAAPAAGTVKRGPGRPPKVTLEAMRAAVSEYLGDKEQEGYDERSGNVRAMLTEYGVKKVPEIPADKYAEVVAKMKEFAAAESNEEAGDEGDGDDDSLL